MEDLKTFDQFLSEAQAGEKAQTLKTEPPQGDKGTDSQKDKENSFQKNNDASHGEKAEHLKESEDGLVESIVDLTEANSVQQTLKNAGIKVLIIKDDKGSIVSQHFVQSENEARKIAKEKLTAGSDGEYYDLGLDKKQTWHKPVTAK